MGQTSLLLKALKQCLRSKGITYANLAVALGLSEASVKRLFSTEGFSLKRLDQVCHFLDMEISDLAQMIDEQQVVSELTLEQEKELVADRKLMLVAQLAINHWKFDEIIEYFQFQKTEMIRLLVRLDKLKLIQLLPNNRVKLLTSGNFAWIEGGPVQRFFQDHVQSEFFTGNFSSKGESLTFVTGMLSDISHALFIKKLAKLASDFNELCHTDSGLPLDDRFGYSLVLAIRPWELSIFNHFRKQRD